MNVVRDGSDDAHIALSFTPALRPEQTVSLLLGSEEIRPEAFVAPTTTLTFIARNAAVGARSRGCASTVSTALSSTAVPPADLLRPAGDDHMNAPLDLDWSTANQQLLVAEFARLRALLGDGDLAAAQAGVAHATACMPAPAALDHLSERFALSRFERDIVLLAAGVEMDMQLARRCREATGSPFPTFGLALAVLPEAHWSALAPLSPLRRWRLVEVDERPA